MEYTTREIRPQDYDQVAEMIKDCIKKSWTDKSSWLLEQFCNKYTYSSLEKRDKEMNIWIALDNEKIVWVIALDKDEVRTFFVSYDQQWKWVWRILYDHLEEYVKEYNMKLLHVEANETVIPMYEHFWFVLKKQIKKAHNWFSFVNTYLEKVF